MPPGRDRGPTRRLKERRAPSPRNLRSLWVLAETARYLREDQRTTRRRVARGELPSIRLPGSRRLLFDPAVVKAFVEASQRPARRGPLGGDAA